MFGTLSYCSGHCYTDNFQINVFIDLTDLSDVITNITSDLNNVHICSENHGSQIYPNKTVPICLSTDFIKSNLLPIANFNIK